MIIIAGWIDFEPGKAEQALEAGRPHIEAGLAEPGCVAYSWTLDPFVPGRVWVYERWDSEEALATHFAAAPYRDMRANLGAYGIKGTDILKYRADLVEPVYDPSGTPRADFFTAAG